MARTRKREAKSDDSYNARRRFVREAQRFTNKMASSVGATRDRYQFLAREALSKAAELYERRGNIQRSSQFVNLSNQLGINVAETMREDAASASRVETLERQSENWVSMSQRDRTAQAILDSPIGSRIYGGLVDVWMQPKYKNGELVTERTTEDINKAIMDYYGVSSMMDVIEKLEAQGIDLYKNPDSVEKYDEVTLAIMQGLYR